jgi:hypothetical protein
LNYQDLWEADPPGSESGWGINLTHQGDIIFATWFAYDLDGTPMWLSATAHLVTEGVYSGTVYRTTGPAFSDVPFDDTKVTRSDVGYATLSFFNGDSGWFECSINGAEIGKRITRLVFRAPGTACT